LVGSAASFFLEQIMAAVDRPRKRIKGRKTTRFGHPLTWAQLKTLVPAAARYQPVDGAWFRALQM
jgi:hypothetical protein